jgi:hypothetical protein
MAGAGSAEPHEWSITMTRTQASRRMLGALVIVAGIALVGCTTGSPSLSSAGSSGSPIASESIEPSVPASSVEPSASATGEEPTESLPAFACVPSVTIASTTGHAQVTDVRVGTHDGYDRVVFEFDSGLPEAFVEGALPPFYADGSGFEIEVTGSAFLKVTMHGATKLSPEGGVTYGGATNFEPAFHRLLQLLEGGDFEAVSTWYLGLDGGSCFRVLALSDPSRLVIDIEH